MHMHTYADLELCWSDVSLESLYISFNIYIYIFFFAKVLTRPNFTSVYITKTCLYNVDPVKPQFYIVKLGFTAVYIIFLISAQKHRLWYSLEPPRRGGSNEYPQSMF